MTNTVMQEAEQIINGARRESYGDPHAQETRIASLWSAYLGVELNPFDVSHMMILLKLSRAKNNTDQGLWHRDSYVDICGYAGLTEKVNAALEGNQGAETEPRQWECLEDIPVNLEVSDKDGDLWSHDDAGDWWHKPRNRGWRRTDSDWLPGLGNVYAPFTEVLDG